MSAMTLELAQPTAGDLDLSLHLDTAVEPERGDDFWYHDHETHAQWERLDNLQQAEDLVRSPALGTQASQDPFIRSIALLMTK